jgi:hypothetical protein
MGLRPTKEVMKTPNEKPLGGESACSPPGRKPVGQALCFRLPIQRVFNEALPRDLSERSLAVAVR